MKRAHGVRLLVSAAAVLLTAAPAFGAVDSPVSPAPHRTAAGPSSQMPPVGTEVPSNMTGPDSVIEVGPEVITADLSGGIKQKAERDPHQPNPTRSVLLRTTGFHLEGASPDREFTVKIALKGTDTLAESSLRMMSAKPPRFVEHDVILVTVTVERRGEPALTLETHAPLSLKCTGLTRFPPADSRYELARPVDLFAPDDSVPTGRIRALPTVRGASPITP
ncbi:hypothetical protein ACFYNY_31940 [Streptomyces sp. NPDC006530]|uniref:hypothetical protein n=1 Tax=Streptomyces sp. NPDC006530 TaxID=3364750 RepID=UPI0036A7FDEC